MHTSHFRPERRLRLFDTLNPSLLVLDNREEDWYDDAKQNTVILESGDECTFIGFSAGKRLFTVFLALTQTSSFFVVCGPSGWPYTPCEGRERAESERAGSDCLSKRHHHFSTQSYVHARSCLRDYLDPIRIVPARSLLTTAWSSRSPGLPSRRCSHSRTRAGCTPVSTEPTSWIARSRRSMTIRYGALFVCMY